MGCCFSSTVATRKTDDQKNQNPTKSHHSPLKPSIRQSDKASPPPPPPEEEEEEAVIKEVLVLSETSTLYKKEQEKITQTPLTLTQSPKTQPDHVSSPIIKPPQQQQEHDLSQVSDMYSMTETMSTTATTTTTATTATATKGPKEDEATSKDNSDMKRKSPATVIKKRPSNGERGSVRARTVDPSPEKRARGRGRGFGEVRSSVQRNVGSRSRSPGTGRAGGVGRGSVGKSPTPTTVTEKTDHSKPVAPMTADGQSQKEEGGNGDDVMEQQGTESLENPLVSLECFIFL